MREIKFRAWDKFNHRMWHEVNVIYPSLEKIVVGSMDMPVELNRGEYALQEFTGLKDKNGKEIYKGDIIKWGHLKGWSEENPVRVAEVRFAPDIQFHSQVGVFEFGSFAYKDDTEKYLEVIGNIHENPELLK